MASTTFVSCYEYHNSLIIRVEADVELFNNKRQEARLDCIARIMCSNIEVCMNVL